MFSAENVFHVNEQKVHLLVVLLFTFFDHPLRCKNGIRGKIFIIKRFRLRTYVYVNETDPLTRLYLHNT